MHALKPSGAHVFFAAPTGSSGYLDVDNVFEFGPEHYLAACDPSALQPGEYRIDR